jgi:hypothetical protein
VGGHDTRRLLNVSTARASRFPTPSLLIRRSDYPVRQGWFFSPIPIDLDREQHST